MAGDGPIALDSVPNTAGEIASACATAASLALTSPACVPNRFMVPMILPLRFMGVASAERKPRCDAEARNVGQEAYSEISSTETAVPVLKQSMHGPADA